MDTARKRALVISGGVLGLALLATGTVAAIHTAGDLFDTDRVNAQYGAYIEEVSSLQTDIAHAHCTNQQRIYEGIDDAETILSRLDAEAIPSESEVYNESALNDLRVSIEEVIRTASASAYSDEERVLANEFATVHSADYGTCVTAVAEEFSATLPRLVNGDTVQTLLEERNRLTEQLVVALDSPADIRPQTLAAATDEVGGNLGIVIESAATAQEVRGLNWLAGTATVDHYRNVNNELTAAYTTWQESRTVADLISVVDLLDSQDVAYALLNSSHQKGSVSSARVEWRQERLAEIRRAEEAEARRIAEEERRRLAEEERIRQEELERLREEEEARQREEEESARPTPPPTTPTTPTTPAPTQPAPTPPAEDTEDTE